MDERIDIWTDTAERVWKSRGKREEGETRQKEGRGGEGAERMPQREPGARNATLIFSSAEMNAKIDPVNLRVRFIEEPLLAQFATGL